MRTEDPRGGLSLLEVGRRMLRGELPPPPVADLIGFRMTELEPGRSTFQLDADPARHGNPMGTTHGGILCDVADAAMGMAFASTLEPGESFTTIELKVNYLKPVWRARLTAEAGVVKRGKRVGLVECDVRDESGGLVARASSTCMILRGEDAATR